MNKYRVGVSLEECMVITIEAENAEQARKAIEDVVGEEGGSTYALPYKHTHRAFNVVDIEEIE